MAIKRVTPDERSPSFISAHPMPLRHLRSRIMLKQGVQGEPQSVVEAEAELSRRLIRSFCRSWRTGPGKTEKSELTSKSTREWEREA